MMVDSSLFRDFHQLQLRVASFVMGVAAWWTNELAFLLPEKTVYWLTDAGFRKLLLIPEDGGVRVQLQHDGGQILDQVSAVGDANVPTAVQNLLKRYELERRDVPLGIQLLPETFFVRQLALPPEVGRSVDTVALADLLRKTPFRQDDIHHGCRTQTSGNRILVTQIVIRRKFVEEAAASMGIEADELAFVEMGSSAGGSHDAYRIRLSENRTKNSWPIKLLLGLIAATVVLGIFASAAQYWRQQSMLDEIDLRVVSTRMRAQEVRSQLDTANLRFSVANQLRFRKRDSIRLLQLWDELSHILPDESWVSELRISPGEKGTLKLTIAGFSTSAANLVGIVDRSPLFDAVSLTAPIAIDPVEQRERFVLQASANQPTAQKAEQ